jgi:hypothetical protein
VEPHWDQCAVRTITAHCSPYGPYVHRRLSQSQRRPPPSFVPQAGAPRLAQQTPLLFPPLALLVRSGALEWCQESPTPRLGDRPVSFDKSKPVALSSPPNGSCPFSSSSAATQSQPERHHTTRQHHHLGHGTQGLRPDSLAAPSRGPVVEPPFSLNYARREPDASRFVVIATQPHVLTKGERASGFALGLQTLRC